MWTPIYLLQSSYIVINPRVRPKVNKKKRKMSSPTERRQEFRKGKIHIRQHILSHLFWNGIRKTLDTDAKIISMHGSDCACELSAASQTQLTFSHVFLH